jgi:PKD repeat protein
MREYTATVEVTNVAPTITTMTVPATVELVDGSAAVAVSIVFFDPAGDADAPYTVAIDCGNDTRFAATSGTCTYTAAGTYTVTATVRDKDGGTGTDNRQIVVAGLLDPALAFAPLPDRTYGEPSFSVADHASTSSAGTITFSTGAGSVGCTVTATGVVTITGVATGGDQCIIDGAASTNSLTPGTCALEDGRVRYLGLGTCTLEAAVAQGSTHLAATGEPQSLPAPVPDPSFRHGCSPDRRVLPPGVRPVYGPVREHGAGDAGRRPSGDRGQGAVVGDARPGQGADPIGHPVGRRAPAGRSLVPSSRRHPAGDRIPVPGLRRHGRTPVHEIRIRPPPHLSGDRPSSPARELNDPDGSGLEPATVLA